ncbi:hypothetical protein ASPVEDRAFT_67896 [Aspergillus versicolor CBS 583.65]|uniref:CENP-V/GFA domain-containing protein n=1 Tax=Aspergillus versicolor CBS 583.65 TaxID=1036611 RepID=A0A1L9P6F4_ASPVE|nr:uncharacterized protein ASPVEDRAFT_67896 [Aspergillus versicolor CBS 583.65]OJI97101.1 hypothetical protein ASPVEDRAFT_67896 [Aspergillus versicolor CBS 583.65]
MDRQESLHGSCMCGRNQYLIQIPDNVTDHARVYFDGGRDNRKSYGTPLTAWLRVPLNWYQSHTQSFFPDETHGTIRRIFSPQHAPHTQRVFCGFCGSPLTYWSEHPRDEADFMSVTIGSLYGEDQRLLEDLELLPQWEESESPGSTAEEEEPTSSEVPVSKSSSTLVVPPDISTSDIARNYRHGTTDGIPWFEEMIEGSGLGKLMKRRRGAGVSDDQSTTIEWEVSEWTSTGSKSESSSAHTAGKRKRGEHTDIVDT